MFKSKRIFSIVVAAGWILSGVNAYGQVKRNRPAVNKQTAVPAAPTSTPTPASAAPSAVERGKKNERPGIGSTATKQAPDPASSTVIPVYFYEFNHPYYLVRKLHIEHDESGKGTISFLKIGYSELVSDPLQISPVALKRLRAAFMALDFLNSTDAYQSTKDYTHLGVIQISMRKEGRERKSEFNWTENKDAKTITEEYRKLGNQYIWMFEINLARENQPLHAPGLFDELDSLVRRNELSDPQQMVPFIRKLSEDERVPLIGRNHAAKIIKTIEKDAEKESR